jgi:hypothetical protein
MNSTLFRNLTSERALNKRWTLVFFSALVTALVIGPVALAQQFNFVNEVQTQPPPAETGFHGIARVGDNWITANFDSGWNTYNSAFVLTGTTTVPGTGQTRALVLNTSTGNLFIGDFESNTIFEVTTAGTILNSFPSGGSALNALAYNPNDNSLYAVHFSGLIQHLTSAGAQLNSFNLASDEWTGAAFDPVRNTLLLLTSDEDLVKEYTTAGAPVGVPLGVDAVTNNGQGLHYNSETGVLHVTSQDGYIAIWQRVVPEPSGLVLAMFGVGWMRIARARVRLVNVL